MNSSQMNQNLSTKLTKLTKDELNQRDLFGNTILHLICKTDRHDFLKILLKNSNLELSICDKENGWNCLHLTIFNNNFIMTNCILQFAQQGNKLELLLKQKDREGFTPMDLLSDKLDPQRVLFPLESIGKTVPKTIPKHKRKLDKSLKHKIKEINVVLEPQAQVQRELVVDEIIRLNHDDNYIPVNLTTSVQDTRILNRLSTPKIKTLHMSTRHAVIVTDTGNVFVCGSASNGRLGLGSVKSNRLEFTPILPDTPVSLVGVSDDFNIMLTMENKLYSFGSNQMGCLGISDSDDNNFSSIPRQIFLKSNLSTYRFIGLCCSKVHCVLYTKSLLFFWGLNTGQMGFKTVGVPLLKLGKIEGFIQSQLRKIEFQYDPISQVVCNDYATLILTTLGDMHLYMNGFHTRFQPPMYNKPIDELYSFKPRKHTEKIHIVKMICRDDKVLLLYDDGNIMQFELMYGSVMTSGEFLSNLKFVTLWRASKYHLHCTDFDLGSDGSIIICVRCGDVYKRVTRLQQKKKKMFKFDKLKNINNVCKVVADGAFKNFIFGRKQLKEVPLKIAKDDFYLDIARFSLLNEESKRVTSYLTTDDISKDDKLQLGKVFNMSNEVSKARVLTAQEWLETAISNYPEIEYHIKSLDGRMIPIHQRLICERGNFHNLFNNSWQSEKIQLREKVIDIQYDTRAILVLLHYLYTNKLISWSGLYLNKDEKFVQSEVENLMDELKIFHIRGQLEFQDFTYLLNKDLNSDTVIALSDGEYRCYSWILRYTSLYFDKLFQWHESDGVYRIDLSDVSKEMFSPIVKYLHGVNAFEVFDSLDIDNIDEFINYLLSVIEVADKLLLFKFKDYIQSYIVKFVNLSNVVILLRHAFELNCDKLFEYCLYVIYDNISFLLFDLEFNKLINESSHMLLKKLNYSFKFFNKLSLTNNQYVNTFIENNSEMLLKSFVFDLEKFNKIFMDDQNWEPVFEFEQKLRNPSVSQRKSSMSALISKPPSPVYTPSTSQIQLPISPSRSSSFAIDDDDDDTSNGEFIEVVGKRRKSSAAAMTRRSSSSVNNNVVPSAIIMESKSRQNSYDSTMERKNSMDSIKKPTPLAMEQFPSLYEAEVATPRPKIKMPVIKKPSKRERFKLLQEQQASSVNSSGSSSTSLTPTVWNKLTLKLKLPTPTKEAPSLMHIMMEQEESLAPKQQPVRSLEDIQLEEEFIRWFNEETLRLQKEQKKQRKWEQNLKLSNKSNNNQNSGKAVYY